MSEINSTPVKSFTIATAAHARHLLKLAIARQAKQQQELEATKAQIVEYENLVSTLPEGVAPAARPVYAVGAVVDFFFGREASRKQLSGVIVAVKTNDKGLPEQYKVTVGEGFDAESYKVYPGAIKVDGEPDAGPDADEQPTDSVDPLDAV